MDPCPSDEAGGGGGGEGDVIALGIGRHCGGNRSRRGEAPGENECANGAGGLEWTSAGR